MEVLQRAGRRAGKWPARLATGAVVAGAPTVHSEFSARVPLRCGGSRKREGFSMGVFGTRLFGQADRVAGLFCVRTRFFHINFVPLIPLASYLVFEEKG